MILVENLQQVNYNHNCQQRVMQGSDGMIEDKAGGPYSPEAKCFHTVGEGELDLRWKEDNNSQSSNPRKWHKACISNQHRELSAMSLLMPDYHSNLAAVTA